MRMRGRAKQGSKKKKKNPEMHHYFEHPKLTACSQRDSEYCELQIKLERSCVRHLHLHLFCYRTWKDILSIYLLLGLK